MRTLLASAVAATALAIVITPAHAVASCANNPARLDHAPAGATASCTGPVAPSTAWASWAASGIPRVHIACPGFTVDDFAQVVPSGGTLQGSGGVCTLTLIADFADTTAVGLVV